MRRGREVEGLGAGWRYFQSWSCLIEACRQDLIGVLCLTVISHLVSETKHCYTTRTELTTIILTSPGRKLSSLESRSATGAEFVRLISADKASCAISCTLVERLGQLPRITPPKGKVNVCERLDQRTTRRHPLNSALSETGFARYDLRECMA